MLVPERDSTASLALDPAERMSWPGARISTAGPKLENSARESLMVEAPTVMAAGTRAGENLSAGADSFPAATTKGMPCLTTLVTCGTQNECGCYDMQGRRSQAKRKNAHSVVHGPANRTTQAHGNDGGLAGREGEVPGEVDAGDDVRCGATAVV